MKKCCGWIQKCRFKITCFYLFRGVFPNKLTFEKSSLWKISRIYLNILTPWFVPAIRWPTLFHPHPQLSFQPPAPGVLWSKSWTVWYFVWIFLWVFLKNKESKTKYEVIIIHVKKVISSNCQYLEIHRLFFFNVFICFSFSPLSLRGRGRERKCACMRVCVWMCVGVCSEDTRSFIL